MDRESLDLRVYTDAAFGTNEDCTSQIGYLIPLCDGKENAQVLDFSSKKSRRVVRSIMGGELIAFADAFDRTWILRYDLKRIYHHDVPNTMLTDSKQIFDVITKGARTSERRLMIDICAAREAYRREEVNSIGLVASEHNVADGKNKWKNANGIVKVMNYGCDYAIVEQWILRESSRSN